MRSKPSRFRTLLSLFVAAVFVIAVTPGSMAMPAPKAMGHAMAGMAHCPYMVPAAGQTHQDHGKPAKTASVCLGMLSCYAMGALAPMPVAPAPVLERTEVAITHQSASGLTLQPDNPPPIA